MKKLAYLIVLAPLFSLAQPVVIGNTHMLWPSAVAVGTDKVYVANIYGVVTVFDLSGNFIGEIGTRGDGPGQLAYPIGIDLDVNGNIYVGDGENLRVVVYAPNGTLLRTITGGFTKNTNPAKLAVHIGADGNLYVLDSFNQKVKVFTLEGTLLRTVGSGGLNPGQFLQPNDFALDASGNVYITDWYYNGASVSRVQKYDNTGAFIDVRGTGDFLSGIAVTSTGRIYASDQTVVRYFDQPTGSGTIGIQGQGGRPGEFFSAEGMYVSSTGDLYICDIANNRVQVFNAASGALVREFGSGLGGVGQLKYPLVSDVDATGKMYIADSENSRVQIFNSDGTFNSTFGSWGFNDGQFAYGFNPRGVKVDASGNMYALGTAKIQVFDNTNAYVRSIGGIQTATGGPFIYGSEILVGDFGGLVKVFDIATGNNLVTFGQAGPAEQHIDYAYDVSADADYYYVTDGYKILVFSHAGAYVRTIAMAGVYSFAVNNNKLYVSLDETVRVYDLNGNFLGGYGGPGATPGKFVGAGKIAVKGNYLLVTDLTRVQRLDLTADLLDPQTVTFGALSAKTFGDAPFNLTASASSGLPVTFQSSDPSIATINGNTLTITGAGTVTITAVQVGNNDYLTAEISQVLTVNKATPVLTIAPIPDKLITDGPFDLVVTTPSPATINYVSTNVLVATVNSAGRVTIVGPGFVSINVFQGTSANYNASNFAGQSLTVNKVPQTITFPEFTSVTYGDGPITLTGTASSGLPVTFTSTNANVASVAGNILTINNAGDVGITATQAGDNTYASVSLARPLTVKKKEQTITFAEFPEKTYGDAPITLAITSSSGLPLNLTSDNTFVASISGTQLTMLAAGTAKITASNLGTSNYLAASLSRTLVVNKKPQVLTFAKPDDRTFSGTTFSVSATSDSGLPVVFSSVTDNITVIINTVTMIKPGKATIKASQTGNVNYLLASVNQSFCINPPTPVISSSPATDGSITLTSTNDTGNQWYKAGTAIANATSKTFSATEAGQYSVKTTIDDCASPMSATFNVVVTGVAHEATNELAVFPNPVVDEFAVVVRGEAGPVSVKVVNALGQEQHASEGLTNQPIMIDARSWGRGVFVVRAVAGDVVLMGRLVKQ